MTYLIELAPETERALEAKAARLGVPVERYAAGVLRRDVEANGQAANGTVDAREKRKVRRLAALEAAVETARGFAATAAALKAPLSDWALSRAGAYDNAE